MARSLCWASVNIVVVLFLLATFSSPPTLPPRLWGESPEPQNIARVRQNKAPMYARYNNLQCLPCHPKLLQHTLFPACLPSCLLEGRAPSSSPGCCRVRVGSLLPNCAGTAPRSPGHHGHVGLALITCRDLQQSHTSQKCLGLAANWSLPASESGRPGCPIPAFGLLTGS